MVLLLEAMGSGSLTEDREEEVMLGMEYQSQRSYEGGTRGELGKASGGSLRLLLLLENILLLLETAASSKKVQVVGSSLRALFLYCILLSAGW